MELPRTKLDTDIARRLEGLPPDTLAPHLPALLEWVQDINWPVARIIAPILARFDARIVPHLRTILQGDDDVWKYWVISAIIQEMDPAVREGVMDEIVRIINTPTEGERREEVDLVARDVMVLVSYGC